MEDLFQILIILIFIIISIVSSLNKKKRMQKANALKQSRDRVIFDKKEEIDQTLHEKKEKSSSEILEEMFGLKINIPESQKSETPMDYSENIGKTENTWDPTKDFEDVSLPIKEERKEKIYEEKDSKKKLELSVDKAKHRAFNEDNKVETQIDLIGIQKLFSKDANLKDYIKVQEILNKPKALRR